MMGLLSFYPIQLHIVFQRHILGCTVELLRLYEIYVITFLLVYSTKVE